MMVIIAHMGGDYHYEALVLVQKHDNIYMDTAYIPFFCDRMLPQIEPKQVIEHAVNIVGSEKILYGGEGTSPKEVADSSLSIKKKTNILGENANGLLSIRRTSEYSTR